MPEFEQHQVPLKACSHQDATGNPGQRHQMPLGDSQLSEQSFKKSFKKSSAAFSRSCLAARGSRSTGGLSGVCQSQGCSGNLAGNHPSALESLWKSHPTAFAENSIPEDSAGLPGSRSGAQLHIKNCQQTVLCRRKKPNSKEMHQCVKFSCL